jgi:molybdopterin/thiamine biosynthesis adenylyltransferase
MGRGFLLRERQPQQDKRRVLIVGAGALGCPAASALAATPGFALTLIDPDRVELSNLQRQLLFDRSTLGRNKAEQARLALLARHPDLEVSALPLRLDQDNATALFESHDFVIDACDDPASKFVINRTALTSGTPFCHAGVARMGGQLMTVIPGRSACLECVFPPGNASPDNTAGGTGQGCGELGLLGPVAGVIGSLQALEASRVLADPTRARGGCMRIFQIKQTRWRRVEFRPRPGCICATAVAGLQAADPLQVQETGQRRQESWLS